MVFFGFTENLRSMTHKDFIGTSKFNRIQADFNAIKDIKVSDLLKENGSLSLLNGAAANMTVGDLFYLYNTLMRIVSPRSNDLAPVFSSMNVDGTWKM
jgi:hypothetical protein